MARSWELSPGRKRNFRSALHQFLRKLTRFSARCLRNRPLSSPNHEISAGENGRTRRVRLVQRFHKIKTALFVCYWHKADSLRGLAACPLLRVKRTSLVFPRMSANDPKRTLQSLQKKVTGPIRSALALEVKLISSSLWTVADLPHVGLYFRRCLLGCPGHGTSACCNSRCR